MNEDHPQGTDPQPTPPPVASAEGLTDEEVNSKKILCGILAIVLNCLGIHKFILGYTTAGIIMLVTTIVGSVLSFLCIPALGPLAMGIIGIVEGVIYLTKSNADFKAIYLDGKKEWF